MEKESFKPKFTKTLAEKEEELKEKLQTPEYRHVGTTNLFLN